MSRVSNIVFNFFYHPHSTSVVKMVCFHLFVCDGDNCGIILDIIRFLWHHTTAES